MKMNFPRMFKYMIYSNVSMFTSFLFGLKVTKNETEQSKVLSSLESFHNNLTLVFMLLVPPLVSLIVYY